MLQAFALFSRYAEIRSSSNRQELLFNFGRAFQFMGMFSDAASSYIKAIELPRTQIDRKLENKDEHKGKNKPANEMEAEEEAEDDDETLLKEIDSELMQDYSPENSDLSMEAAFNLSLIYWESGNKILARDIMSKHLSII